MTTSSPFRTTALAAAVTAAATLTAATSASAAPTLRLDAPCYATGSTIRVEGEGYTSSSPVDLSLTAAGVASTELRSDGGGLLRALLPVEPGLLEAVVAPDAWRERVVVTAVDRQAASAGAGPEARATTETFLSWSGSAITDQRQDALRPRRRMTIEAFGLTEAIGRRTYLHYVRGGRRLATVRLGVLRGPCGDVRRTLRRAFPFRRVRRGRWLLVLNFSRTDHRAHPHIPMPSRVAG